MSERRGAYQGSTRFLSGVKGGKGWWDYVASPTQGQSGRHLVAAEWGKFYAPGVV